MFNFQRIFIVMARAIFSFHQYIHNLTDQTKYYRLKIMVIIIIVVNLTFINFIN